MTVIFDCCTIY